MRCQFLKPSRVTAASRANRSSWLRAFVFVVACTACQRAPRHHASPTTSGTVPSALPTPSVAVRSTAPERIERHERAMGTNIEFIAYTNESVDLEQAHGAIDRAMQEIERLEQKLSEWRPTSEVARINDASGNWVEVSQETRDVIQKTFLVSRLSQGALDITFQSMGHLWKFGTNQDPFPEPPSAKDVMKCRQLVDYRRVQVDGIGGRVRVAQGRKIGLGGIAKGYIVDRAVGVLRGAGLRAFLVQAGGDLYAAGRKPDGTRWTASIQDPRAPDGEGFATIELEEHAFSTAGDYARAFMHRSKRYHHIIDPRTGYPAEASRSVTIYAPDALTADMLDDAVFVLGPKEGLKLVTLFEGVGTVIVDARNQVFVSPLLEDKVVVHRAPTDGP